MGKVWNEKSTPPRGVGMESLEALAKDYIGETTKDVFKERFFKSID
jgi:hypothetical protein